MKLYAERAALRTRQQLRDLAVVLWLIAWCTAGRALFRTIDGLRTATTSVRDAGAGFAGRLDDVAGDVGRLPVVGGDLRRPFSGAADAGRALEHAGAAAGDGVHAVALWAGFLLALLPIAWVLAKYLPARISWVREADAARHIRMDDEGLRLFALRAVASTPLHRLRRAEPDPAGALARGEHEALAAIELGRLGLQLPRTR